jgi:hypothetical protein
MDDPLLLLGVGDDSLLTVLVELPLEVMMIACAGVLTSVRSFRCGCSAKILPDP